MSQWHHNAYGRPEPSARPGGPVAWVAAALAVMLALPARSEPAPAHDWFVHAYVAQFNQPTFVETLRLKFDFDDSWLAAVGVGHTFAAPSPHTQLEWELQAAKHWGLQDHPEANALATVRWHGFSWDHILRNTFAFGLGGSYAFDIPAVEEMQGKGTRALVYMQFEITAAPPQVSDWSAFVRIHHRSGVFGLVSDADGSNFVGIGVRHHF